MKLEEREKLVNINLKLIFNSKGQSLHSSKFKNIKGTYIKDSDELVDFMVSADLIENETIENNGIYFLTELGYHYAEESSWWTDHEFVANELAEKKIIHRNSNYRSVIHSRNSAEKNRPPIKERLTKLSINLFYSFILILIHLYIIQQITDSSVPIWEIDIMKLIKKL